MLQGAQHLTNAELLAIIIGSGLPGISAVQLMQQLLLRCNHRLQELQQLPLEEIKAIKGIGAAKAVKIKAALTLAHRIDREQHPIKSPIT